LLKVALYTISLTFTPNMIRRRNWLLLSWHCFAFFDWRFLIIPLVSPNFICKHLKILYFSDQIDKVNKHLDYSLNKRLASAFLNTRKKRSSWVEMYCEVKEAAYENDDELIIPCANPPWIQMWRIWRL